MADFLGFNRELEISGNTLLLCTEFLTNGQKFEKLCFMQKVDHEPSFVMSFDFSGNKQWHMNASVVRNCAQFSGKNVTFLMPRELKCINTMR